MTAIVISYRREDSQGTTGRIFDRLEGHYGQGHVFMDIDNIPFGTDFRHHLQETLDRCDILLVVVGPRWFGRNKDGQPRLFEEADWVRIEVATALAKNIPVIPLLVEGAQMPKPRELPEDLQGFAFRQAAVLDVGIDFRVHMERLTKSMDRILLLKKLPEPQSVSQDVLSVEEQKSSISQSNFLSADDAPPTDLAADQSYQSSIADQQPAPVERDSINELQTPEESIGSRPNGTDEITSSAAVSTSTPSGAINPTSSEMRSRLTALAIIAPFAALIAIVGGLAIHGPGTGSIFSTTSSSVPSSTVYQAPSASVPHVDNPSSSVNNETKATTKPGFENPWTVDNSLLIGRWCSQLSPPFNKFSISRGVDAVLLAFGGEWIPYGEINRQGNVLTTGQAVAEWIPSGEIKRQGTTGQITFTIKTNGALEAHGIEWFLCN